MLVIAKNFWIITPFLLLLLSLSMSIRIGSPYLARHIDYLVLCATVLLLVASFIVSLLGHLEIGTYTLLKITTPVLIACSVLILTFYVIKSKVKITLIQSLLREGVNVGLAAVISLYAMSPAFFHLSQALSTFGLATLFNGDIANYSLVADNVLISGFADSGHILNANYGEFAEKNSYITATSILNLLSAISSRPTYQVLLPAMILTLIFLYLALRFLMRSIVSTRRVIEVSVICFALLNSLTVHTIGQFYISALLCTATLAIVLGSILNLSRTTAAVVKQINFLILVFASSLSIYAYGHIGLVVTAATPIVGTVLFFISPHTESRKKRASVIHGTQLLGSKFFSLLLSAPVLPSAWNLLQAQGSAQVGYVLRDLNPFGLFIFPTWIQPSWTRGSISTFWNLAGWVLLTALVLFLSVCVSKKVKEHTTNLILAGIGVLFVMSVLVWGLGEYQTWKLWSLIVPLLVILLGALVGRISIWKPSAGVLTTGLLIGVALTIPWSVWGDTVWNPSVNTVTSRELELSVARTEGLGYEQLNVKLSPYLETMMAGTMMSKPQIAFSSESYLGQPMQILSTCTFTRLELVPEGVTFVELTLPYVLAMYPAECR